MKERVSRPKNHQKTVEYLQEKIRKADAMETSLLQLAAETDPDKIISLLAELAAKLINAETLAVPLLSADNLQVHYDYVYGRHKEAFLGMALPIEDAGLCGWVLENRKPILTNNLLEDSRVKKEGAAALGITAAVLVPLIARGRIIGGLSAFNKADGSPFTEDDLSSLAHLANYAAVTIENARLAESLRNEKVKLEAILDGVKDGIVFIYKDGTIANVNKAMEKYIPMKTHELTGANVRDFESYAPLAGLFYWRAKAVPGKRCWEVLGCGEEDCPVYNTDIIRCWTLSGEHCYKTVPSIKGLDKVLEVCAYCEVFKQAGLKLAEPREVQTMGKTVQATSTLVVNGAVKDVFGEVMVFHNVSAEKQAEQQRSDFISMLTHDLKAPLTSVLGYCDLIAQEEDLGRLREMNNAVMDSTGRLIRMINDFLELSRLDAKKIKLNLMLISLGSFLPTVLQPFEPQARTKGVNLSWDVAKGTPEVRADIDQLSRIVGNLVLNSLKHVTHGGSISVSASSGNARTVDILVKDDGSGIDEKDLPRVFDRYYTGSDDAMRSSGLGLAIVKLLTEAHGGSVSVKSEKGKGARFTVSLPAG